MVIGPRSTMIGKGGGPVYALGATLLEFHSALEFLAAVVVSSGRNGLL